MVPGHGGQDKDFNLSLKTNVGSNVGSAKVVQQDLSRVILNIVNNDCCALNGKKKKQDESFKPEILLTTSGDNDLLLITIKDNGTDMLQSILDKVFNPFFTTKPNSEGTGLGLFLSYDIVTNIHKGRLEVESKEGDFTEFRITIPIK